MSLKLKALGLGLIAALAMSAMTVVSATAETGGHFVSEVSHTTILGHDELDNPTEFTALGNTVRCNTATYHGTVTGTTVESITVTPTYGGCEVPGIGPAHINMAGCTYTFTVRKVGANTGHNTVHLTCPAGSAGPTIQATGPFGNCKVNVTPNQTPTQGVTYTQITESGKHAVTVDVTADGIHAVRTEGGFFQCGTSATTDADAEMHGEATITARDVNQNPVGVTAT